MIKFDVLETGKGRTSRNYDVFTDSQDLTGKESETNETIDSFLEKIDIQTIKAEDDGFAFHIRTKPIKEKRKGWHAFVPDCGVWKNKVFQPGKTIDDYFGVDMGGMPSKVMAHSTPEGVIYDIFGNVDADSRGSLMQASYHYKMISFDEKEPFLKSAGKFFVALAQSTKTHEPNPESEAYSREHTKPDKKETFRDNGVRRRKFAKSLEKVAQIYEKLGIADGRFVLSPEVGYFRKAHLTSDLELDVTESDEFGNCSFYDVALLETGEDDPVTKRKQRKRKRVTRKKKSETKERKTGEVYFKDIVGVDEAVGRLKNAQKYFEDPQKYVEERGFGLSPGCILYGPPGTGKTMLAKAFANETGAPIIEFKASEVLDKYVGESDKNLEGLFAEAEEVAEKDGKCVIFIDEFEQLARSRGNGGHETSDRLVDAFLTYLDGFSSKGNVYVIGATNLINDIDPALRNSKGGRLEEIPIPAPSYEGRKKIVKNAVEALRDRAKFFPFENLDYNLIAKESEGYTGRLLVGEQQSVLRNLSDKYHDARERDSNAPRITTQDWVKEFKKYNPDDRKIGFTGGKK